MRVLLAQSDTLPRTNAQTTIRRELKQGTRVIIHDPDTENNAITHVNKYLHNVAEQLGTECIRDNLDLLDVIEGHEITQLDILDHKTRGEERIENINTLNTPENFVIRLKTI